MLINLQSKGLLCKLSYGMYVMYITIKQSNLDSNHGNAAYTTRDFFLIEIIILL